jgi:hypothetical protein
MHDVFHVHMVSTNEGYNLILYHPSLSEIKSCVCQIKIIKNIPL